MRRGRMQLREIDVSHRVITIESFELNDAGQLFGLLRDTADLLGNAVRFTRVDAKSDPFLWSNFLRGGFDDRKVR